MSDKKNDDFVVRMAEGSDAYESEKAPFLAKAGTPAQTSRFPKSFSGLDNSPGLSVLSYCLASISMTVVNKYVVSGSDWNLNFLYLAIQVRPPPFLRYPDAGQEPNPTAASPSSASWPLWSASKSA
jgi:GDP-mannose transporter